MYWSIDIHLKLFQRLTCIYLNIFRVGTYYLLHVGVKIIISPTYGNRIYFMDFGPHVDGWAVPDLNNHNWLKSRVVENLLVYLLDTLSNSCAIELKLYHILMQHELWLVGNSGTLAKYQESYIIKRDKLNKLNGTVDLQQHVSNLKYFV